MFTLSDACRTGAAEAVRELKKLGIKTAMLTGDSHAAAMQANEKVHYLQFRSFNTHISTYTLTTHYTQFMNETSAEIIGFVYTPHAVHKL